MFLINSLDTFMIGYFMGTKEVGIYYIDYRLASLCSFFLLVTKIKTTCAQTICFTERFTAATGIAVESIPEPTGEAWLVQLEQALAEGDETITALGASRAEAWTDFADAIRELQEAPGLLQAADTELQVELGELMGELRGALSEPPLEQEAGVGVEAAAEVVLQVQGGLHPLGRARFEVYGTDVPPDATSSPRITDGTVLPYEYNGTVAPVYTTFFGMYDHYHSYGDGSEWDLPDRWLPAPPQLDLDTPLNFVSTADTYGGNSGSPAITPQVQMVGLNFDRNIEGLSRDFIYLPERGRNIMVDVRAITEALDDVYDADRIIQELVTGELVEREDQADESIR